MALLNGKRRAEEFDAALAAVERRGDVPAQRAPLSDDLAIVARLRETGEALAPEPSDEFRQALRTRLLAVATVQGVGSEAVDSVARPNWRSRATTVTAGVAASVVAVTGVAVATTQSLPGDPFYGVKRAAEDLRLRLATTPESEGQRHLDFAENRLAEITALAEDGLSPDERDAVLAALEDMDAHTREGRDLLTQTFRSTQLTVPLEQLVRFAESQRSGLRALLPEFTGRERARGEASLALATQIAAQASELLTLVDCDHVCDPTAVAPTLPGSGTTCDCPSLPPRPSLAPTPGGSARPQTSPGSSPGTGTPSQPGTPGLPLPTSQPNGSSDPVVPGVPLPTEITDPLGGLTDPLPSEMTDPLDNLTDPLDGVTDPLQGSLTDPLAPSPTATSGSLLDPLLHVIVRAD